jgi:hypothetical protein
MTPKEPTEAQKKAGNYQKEHRFMHGMRLSVENKAGSTRRGVGEDGKPWESKMAHDYGYIRYTTGKDKDHIDAFLGPDAEDPKRKVYVIDQSNKKGEFDEHKVMMGFADSNEAYHAYHENYPDDWDGFDAITEMELPEFKQWAYSGKSGKRKRVSELRSRMKRGGRVGFEDGGSTGAGDSGGDSGGDAGDGGDGGDAGVGDTGGDVGGIGDGVGPSAGPGSGPGGPGTDPGEGAVGSDSGVSGGDDGSDASVSDADVDATLADMAANPPSSNSNGIAGQMGISNPAIAAAVNQGLGIVGNMVGIPTGVIGMTNAAINNNSGQAAGVIGGAIGMGIAGPVGGIAGQAIGNAIGNMDGVPAADVPADPTGGGSASSNNPQGALAQYEYYRQRGDSAMPAPIAANQSYLPGFIPQTMQLYAKGGSVQPLDCACGHTGYAEGGSVEEERPFVGYRGRRQERNNDREGAKEVPLQAARGIVSGTLGFGGDIEGLMRQITNLVGGNVDQTPALPTSDFYKDVLPLPPKSAAGRAASGAGSALGMPMSGVALGAVRGAKAAAPAVRGALEQVAQNAMAPRALSSQAGAIKMPGGNWMNEFGPQNLIEDLQGAAWDPQAKNWVEKKIGKYVKNDLGTATDPLIGLESQGISHLNDLGQRAEQVNPGPARLKKHVELTGRQEKTPWEKLSDSQIAPHTYKEMKSLYDEFELPLAPWAQGEAGKASTYYDIPPRAATDLGFDHIVDYINSAVEAGNAAKLYGTRGGFGGEDGERMNKLLARGLDIDPDKLTQMSFPDMVRKVSEWNKYLEETKRIADRAKGVKQTLKKYDDTGLQWDELNEAGLADEGNAMGHCVGGYCSQVKGGNTRIISLTDKGGQPHVTIELGRPAIQVPEDFIEGNLDSIYQRAYKIAEDNKIDLEKDDQALQEFFDQASDELYLSSPDAPQVPWNIRQIKGKGNLAPIKDYQPAVQDFVKNMGPWGEVRDLQNSGLFRYGDLHGIDPAYRDRVWGLPNDAPSGLYTREELKKAFEDANPERHVDDEMLDIVAPRYNRGYAKGGLVSGPQTVGLAQFGQGDGGGGYMQNGLGGIGGIGGQGLGQGSPAPLPPMPAMPQLDLSAFIRSIGPIMPGGEISPNDIGGIF